MSAPDRYSSNWRPQTTKPDPIFLLAFTLPLMPAALTDHVHFSESTREQQGVFIASSVATLATAGLAAPRPRPSA